MAGAVTTLSDSTFDETVASDGAPVLVDFWAPWCGPCKAMLPYVEKLAEEYAGKIKVVKLNTQDNMETASKYGITSIPTFVVVKGGEVQEQVIGALKYDGLKGLVDPHV